MQLENSFDDVISRVKWTRASWHWSLAPAARGRGREVQLPEGAKPSEGRTDWAMNIARPSQASYSRTKPVSGKHVTAAAAGGLCR